MRHWNAATLGSHATKSKARGEALTGVRGSATEVVRREGVRLWTRKEGVTR